MTFDPDRTDDEPRSGITAGTPATPELERVPSWLVTSVAWTWRVLVLIIGFGAVLYVLSRLALVTVPVIVALILATLCVPPARALEGRGFPRAAAATTIVVGGVAGLGGLIAALIPPFVRQVQELRPTITAAVDQLFETLESSPLGYDRTEVMELLGRLTDQAQANGGEIAGQVATGLAIVGQVVTGLVLAIVLLFFFVKDGEPIVGWMLERTPAHYREVARATGRRAWVALSGFVRGTAAIALIDATFIGIGLAIVGVPLVLPLSMLVFLGAFIPVIGAFVSGLVAVLVAFASGGLVKAAIVLAIVVGVQQFEGNVLHPTIMRRAVALHPVVVLTALAAGAMLGGIIGAFLAVPVAAVASAVANELRLRHEADGDARTADADDLRIGGLVADDLEDAGLDADVLVPDGDPQAPDGDPDAPDGGPEAPDGGPSRPVGEA